MPRSRLILISSKDWIKYLAYKRLRMTDSLKMLTRKTMTDLEISRRHRRTEGTPRSAVTRMRMGKRRMTTSIRHETLITTMKATVLCQRMSSLGL